MATRAVVTIAPEENPSSIKQITIKVSEVSFVQRLIPIIDAMEIKEVTMIKRRYSPVRAIQKPEESDPQDIEATLGRKKRPAREGE